MKTRLLPWLLSVVLTISSCKVEDIGKNLSAGVSQNMEAIGKNLLSGVNKGLNDSAFQQNLYHLIDSLVSTAGNSANRSAKNILDTLTSQKLMLFTRQLIEEATGEKLKSNLSSLRNELLGAATNERIKLLVTTAVTSALNDETAARLGRLRDELLGDATNLQITRLRDSLLGTKTASAVKAIVDSALRGASSFLQNDLKKGIDDNASVIQKYAVRWLLLLAAIAIVIILIIWRQKEKYAKTVTVMASQIQTIPDQRAYDELTSRIKEKAIDTGVQPTLDKVLKENGLLGKENWEAKQLKSGVVIQNKN